MSDYEIVNTYRYYYDQTGCLVEKKIKNREEYLKKVGVKQMKEFYEDLFDTYDDFNNDFNDSRNTFDDNSNDNYDWKELEDEYWSD